MDFHLVFFPSYELLISLIFGLLTVYIATRFINLVFLKANDDEERFKSNVSISLFTGGMIVCVLILVQGSVLPSVDALRTMVLGQEEISFSILAISFAYCEKTA